MIMVLKILLTVLGGLFLVLDFWAFVRQKMNESMGIPWGFASLALMLVGIISLMAGHGYDVAFLLLFFVSFLLLFLLFRLSRLVSVLMMKNQELAMQVSLLNQENERILHEVGILTDEEDSIRN